MIQMVINIFVCRKGLDIISKMAIRSDRIERRAIGAYLLLALVLLLLNQGAFMFFKNNNLYEVIGVKRGMGISELKEWAQRRRVELYQIGSVPAAVPESTFLEIVSVLTHPARRLSYDSFGQHGVEYAWAFKSPAFILQTIIGSAFFFVICTFMSVINKKKSDLKQAFKLEIFAMILLFIWEVDLIITTESRLQASGPDLLDYLYSAFPVFERREMIKAIIIPCMNLVEIFIRFYTISRSEERLLHYGNIEPLKLETNQVYEAVAKLNMDEHINDRVNVALENLKRTCPMQAEAYHLQRELLRALLFVEGEEILARPQVGRVLKYFKLQ